MNPIHALIAGLALVSVASLPVARAGETWRSSSGETFNAELEGIYGGQLFFSLGRNRGYRASFGDLDAESKERATVWFQNYVKRRSETPRPMVRESDSRLSRFLERNLVRRENGEIVDYDFGSETEPDFYAFYFSARWCGPCRSFTPRLVGYYNAMRKLGYKDFELVFVSWDRSRKEMELYMEEDEMPWPAVAYSKRDFKDVARFEGTGIPCLVITDRKGNLLFHSYDRDEYLGPDKPKDGLTFLLKAQAALDERIAALKSAAAEKSGGAEPSS